MKGQNLNKMDDCQRKEELVTFLYGECSPAEERAFKEHIQTCISCQREVTEFGVMRESLQTWQVTDVPRVNIDLQAATPRSLRAILSELSAALPAWFKFSTGLATACSAVLILLAVMNTQVSYDQNGFNVKLALFEKSAAAPDEVATRAMVDKIINERQAQLDQDLNEKRAQIKQDLEKKISQLTDEIAQLNSSELSRASLELKRQHRAELERALLEIERRSRQRGNSTFEDDPFSLWGGLDRAPRASTEGN